MRGDFISFIGTTIKKRYFILDRIGSGGEGTMYLAKDLETGVLRAVKELPKSGRKEARLLKLLDYPSLPGMIDYAEQGDSCYLVMEYIRGESLGSMLKRGYCFSPEEIQRIGRKLLGTLEYLHTRAPAVYYGDLKPDNILMTREGNLYLVDFGSAVFDYGNPEFVCKGTRGFAAPEQYEGKITPVSDIYGLGRTLALLSEKCRWKIVRQYPKFLLFLYRCCRQDGTKRWQTVAQARKFLETIHPHKFQFRVYLAAAAAAACTLAAVLTAGTFKRTQVPEMARTLQVVCAPYYSMLYRSGSSRVRRVMEENMEENLLRMLRVYKDEKEQIRLWELLIANSELQKSAEKTELYYRQLLIYHRDYERGLEAYSRFLIRQEKTDFQKSESKEEKVSARKKAVSSFSGVELGGFDIDMDLGASGGDTEGWDESGESVSSAGNSGSSESSSGEDGGFSSGESKSGQTDTGQSKPAHTNSAQENSGQAKPGQSQASQSKSGQTESSGSGASASSPSREGSGQSASSNQKSANGSGTEGTGSQVTKNQAGIQETTLSSAAIDAAGQTANAHVNENASPPQTLTEKPAPMTPTPEATPEPTPTNPPSQAPASVSPQKAEPESDGYDPEDLLQLVKEGLLGEETCVHPLSLFYWKKEQIPAGEICLKLNAESVLEIVSVRINGKETDWRRMDDKLWMECPDEENEIEAVLLRDPKIHRRIIQRMLY